MKTEVLKMNNEEENTVTMELSQNEFKRLQRLLELDKTKEEEQEEQEQEAKNHNFIQLYKDNMPELRWLSMNHAFALTDEYKKEAK